MVSIGLDDGGGGGGCWADTAGGGGCEVCLALDIFTEL